MKEYNLTFWEKQIVWNKRFVVVKTDKNPLELTIEDLEQPEFDIDWIDVLDSLYDNIDCVLLSCIYNCVCIYISKV